MSLDAPLNGAADWTEAGPLAEMTQPEEERRAVLTATVWRNLHGFQEAGAALAEIRDSRLYRSTHPTFAAFCADEFSLPRSGAYELMAAAEVVSGIPDTALRPDNIGQAVALSAAPPEERADVMAAVAGKGKPTAAAIAAEVESRHPKPAEAECEGCHRPTSAHALYGGLCDECRVSAEHAASQRTKADDDACHVCGEITPDVASGWCADCWIAANPSPNIDRKQAAKPPTLRDHPEVKEVDRVWAPAKALGKGLRSMLPALEVMEVLPADSLESFDDLADEAIAWGKRWKEERKAAQRLRLMGVKGLKR